MARLEGSNSPQGDWANSGAIRVASSGTSSGAIKATRQGPAPVASTRKAALRSALLACLLSGSVTILAAPIQTSAAQGASIQAASTQDAPASGASPALPASHQQAPDSTATAKAMAAVFAPGGTLRASINLGNPVLASLDPKTGKPVGVSVDLAAAFAKQLGVPLALVPVKSAGQSVDNVDTNKADIGFFAVDPKRGEGIAFTKPYVLIEGFYMVRDTSPIKTNEQVDQPGITVAVGKGSAYDLFLTRALHHATIVRIPTSPAVVDAFLKQNLSVAAGVKQQLEENAKHIGGLRMLDQRFMVIRQAMGVPKDRGADAQAYLAAFVEKMKTSGFVQASLARHHINGATVPEQGASD